MNKQRWLAALGAIILLLAMLSTIVLPALAQGATLLPVTAATQPDTDTDAPQAYGIASVEDLIYAGANPTYFGNGDTLCLTKDLNIKQYSGDFAADFLNFDPDGTLETDLLADFDGLGHTIYNYKESLPLINGRANGVIRNLIFEAAEVQAGATQSAILARTTELGILLENVHIRHSKLTTQNDAYCGALIAFAQNNNKRVVIRNCSIIDTHISTTYNGGTLGIGLMIGRYRTGSTLFVQNCLAVNSSLSGITATTNGGGLLVGDVSKKAANGQETYGIFNNVGIINCSIKNYGSGSLAHAIVTAARDGATVKATGIFATGNKISAQAAQATATNALTNLFYQFSGSTVDLDQNYKVDPGVTKIWQSNNTATANHINGFSAQAVLDHLNLSEEPDYLPWSYQGDLPSTNGSTTSAFTAGDVNNDGKVNNLDAMVMLKVLSGGTYNGALNEKAMFLDGDGTVTMADAVLLMKKAQGQAVSLTPAPFGATVSKNQEGIYYLENYSLRLISQNIFHGGSSYRIENGKDMNATSLRTERQRILMQECGYFPDVVMLQEYRNSTWFNLYEKTIFPQPEFGKHVVSRADPARDTQTEAKALGEAAGGHTYATAYQPDERLAIFWRNDKYELVTDENGEPIKGMFYFSDTPDVNSPSFGTENNVLDQYSSGIYVDNRNRICIWVKLRDIETDQEMYIFDFHFPNGMDETNDKKAINLVNNKVQSICAQYGDAGVILGGDMNTHYFIDYDAPAIAEMAKYFDDVGEMMGNLQGTYPRFSRNITPDGTVTARIDYFYLRDDGTVPVEYKVMEETFDADNNVLENFGGYNPNGSASKDNVFWGYWASDHLGLYGKFVMDPTDSAPADEGVTPATATKTNAQPVGIALSGNKNYNMGDCFTASIYLNRNSNLAALPLSIQYDPHLLAIKNITKGTVMDCAEYPGYYAFTATDNTNLSGVLLQIEFEVIASKNLQNNIIGASFSPQYGFGPARYSAAGTPVAVGYSEETVFAAFNLVAPVQYGDVDGNGAVETADVVLIMRNTVGLATPTMTHPEMGDLDGKAGLSVVDAQIILWHLSSPGSTLSPIQ